MELLIASAVRREKIEEVRYLEISTTLGIVGILPGHADFCALIPGGRFRVITSERVQEGRSLGGFLEVRGGKTIHLWLTGFAWEGEALPELPPKISSEESPHSLFVRRIVTAEPHL
jgi:F0F1-type ATP synthase epsilon subunit